MRLEFSNSIDYVFIGSIKDLGVHEEKVVQVGMDEEVILLKVFLVSKTVLTDVFLEKKTTRVSVSEVD